MNNSSSSNKSSNKKVVMMFLFTLFTVKQNYLHAFVNPNTVAITFFCPFMCLGCVLKSLHNICVSTTFLAFHIVSANQITEQRVSRKRLICTCALKRYERLSKRFSPFRPIIWPYRNAVFRFGQSFDSLAPFGTVCMYRPIKS